ncbi:hypothetical protein ACFSQ3_10715 [Sphingobacterium corticis]|uniref:DUF4906 domain-containing protein n=1 Tax=Sphingobacterium corticis TaxID=1812823 RepID=A0ABW5NN61_9SPHI
MNKLFSSSFRYSFLAISLLVIALTSCTKDDKTESEGDGTEITIDLAGIDDPTNVNSSIARSVTGTANAESILSQKILAQEIKHFEEDGLDAIVTLSEIKDNSIKDSINTTNNVDPLNTKSSATLTSPRAPLPSGIAYRVVFYENGVYRATVNATSGSEFKWTSASRLRTYTWFAYSVNTSSAFTGNFSSTATTIDVSNSSAFLFASGTISTNPDNRNNKLNIVLQNKSARIDVVLDGRGMFGRMLNISANNITPNHLKSGTFNWQQQTYNSTYNPNTLITTVNNAGFVNYNTSSADSIRVGTFYTVDGVNPISDFGIRASFSVSPDASNFGNRNFSNKNFNFTGTTFTPQIGYRYRITITPIMSTKTLNGVEWARTNLFYNATRRAYGFRHHGSNRYGTSTNVESAGEFFNWRAILPTFGAATNQGDPCAMVYPATKVGNNWVGHWRMPTRDEATALANTSSPARSLATATDDQLVRYFNFNYGGTDDYGNNWIVFILYGYRNVGSNTITGFSNNGNVDGEGYFWTSTAGATPGQAYQLSFNTDGATILTNTERNVNAGLNIRCVRNTTWTSANMPALPPATYQ